MNPLLLLLVLNFVDQKNNRRYVSSYFDTFKMEMLVDKLQVAINTLDKVNRLSQIMHEPRALNAPAQPVNADDSDSSPTAFPALFNNLNLSGLTQLAPLINQLGNLGDFKNISQNLGPIINMLSNAQEK